jgi:hypothetical protein
MMDQRFLIVGTSNSIRRGGYAEYLGRMPSLKLTNVSIGASTSIHSIWRTSDVEFGDHDAAILDFAVNEDVMLRNGATSTESIRPIVAALICRATARHCLPVLLILPRQQTVESLARPFYRALGQEFGLPVLDGYDVIEHLARTEGIAREAMFDDAAHVTSWVSALIAEILQEGLRRILQRPARWREAEWSTPRLEILDVTGQGGAETPVVERATSRFSSRFLRLGGPSRLELRVAPQSRIIGLRLNLRETNAFLRFPGSGEVVMDLRNSYYQSEKYPVVISALPLPAPLAVPSGQLVIETLAEPAAGDRLSDASGELGRSRRPATGELEVADVFVETMELQRSHALPALTGEEQDLFNASAREKCRLAAAVYGAFNTPEDAAARIAAFNQRQREKRAARLKARGAPSQLS